MNLPLKPSFLLVAAVAIASGVLLASARPAARRFVDWASHSKAAAILFFGLAVAIFCSITATLGDADALFVAPHQFRIGMTVLSAAVGLLSFRFLPDYLGVRGLAVLWLIFASHCLRVSFGEWDAPGMTAFIWTAKTFIYATIVIALWLGASPFKAHPWSATLLEKRPAIAKALGAVLVLWGAAIAATTLLLKAA